MNMPSTKPYLIRAIYEWCCECGYTPMLIVKVTSEMDIPAERVSDGEIIFNIDQSAVHNLVIGNDIISFSARFNGVAKEIAFPTEHIKSIFAKEVNHGLAFPEVDNEPEQGIEQDQEESGSKTGIEKQKSVKTKKGKTTLRVVK